MGNFTSMDDCEAWTGSETNPAGRAFKLYLLPAQPPNFFTQDEAGMRKYATLCTERGLRTVISGWGSYDNNQNCNNPTDGNCMELPKGASGTGSWGSCGDYAQAVHNRVGWSNFVQQPNSTTE